MAERTQEETPSVRLVVRSISNRGRISRVPRQLITVLPDAVNQTVGMSPLREYEILQSRSVPMLRAVREESYKKEARDRYRLAKSLLDPVFGKAWLVASDEAVDLAIAREELEADQRASLAQLYLGIDRSDVETLADQYAGVSNFYTSLGSPNVMPLNYRLVMANPRLASAQLRYGLRNPGMSTLLMASTSLLGGGIASSNAFNTAMLTVGRSFIPSEWATGMAQYFPRFAPLLLTAGLLGDAAMAASLAGPGVVDLVGGIKEGDTNRAMHGATDVVLSVPFLQEMRPLSTLANGLRAFSPSVTLATPKSTLVVDLAVDLAVFSPTARTIATAAAVGTPVVAAASDAQLTNPEASWYENLWSLVRNNPAETAFGTWLLWKSGRGLRNRYIKEPAGRPAEFTEPKPVKLVIYDRPLKPSMEREPVPEDFMISRVEPYMPRPTEFTEPAPIRPTGLRPKNGKRARKWDEQNKAYMDWEARRDAHNESQREAREAWDNYDSQEPKTFLKATYEARHKEWEDSKKQYDEAMAKYEKDMESYTAAQGKADKEYETSVKDWEAKKAEYDKDVKEYEEGEPYKKWLARRQNYRNIGLWAKNNWLGLGLGGWVLGSHLFGGDNPSTPTNNPNNDNSVPVNSTITLPAGFRPVQGVNDSTSLIVVPNSAGESDSIITIEPVTRNRFGRGGNLNQ